MCWCSAERFLTSVGFPWRSAKASCIASAIAEPPLQRVARGTEQLLAGGELTVLQHTALATKVQNQQKAKYWNRNVLQKNGVLTAEEA